MLRLSLGKQKADETFFQVVVFRRGFPLIPHSTRANCFGHSGEHSTDLRMVSIGFAAVGTYLSSWHRIRLNVVRFS